MRLHSKQMAILLQTFQISLKRSRTVLVLTKSNHKKLLPLHLLFLFFFLIEIETINRIASINYDVPKFKNKCLRVSGKINCFCLLTLPFLAIFFTDYGSVILFLILASSLQWFVSFPQFQICLKYALYKSLHYLFITYLFILYIFFTFFCLTSVYSRQRAGRCQPGQTCWSFVALLVRMPFLTTSDDTFDQSRTRDLHLLYPLCHGDHCKSYIIYYINILLYIQYYVIHCIYIVL